MSLFTKDELNSSENNGDESSYSSADFEKDSIKNKNKGTSSIAETLWEEYGKKEPGEVEDENIKSSVDLTKKDKKIDDIQAQNISNDSNMIPDSGIKDEKEEDMIDNSNDDEMMEKYLSSKNEKKSWVPMFVGVVLLLGALAGAFFAGRMTAKKETPIIKEEVVNCNNQAVEQESTEDLSINKSNEEISEENADIEADFSETNILILNGGGTVGAAGKMKDIIGAEDESIKKVIAENAVGDYKGETIVYYQEKVRVEAEKLLEILRETYGDLKIDTMENLPNIESKSDIVVIIGEGKE